MDRTDFLNLRALTRVTLADVQRSAGLYAEADAKGNVADAARLRITREAAGPPHAAVLT